MSLGRRRQVVNNAPARNSKEDATLLPPPLVCIFAQNIPLTASLLARFELQLQSA